jgi:hypothetical protein
MSKVVFGTRAITGLNVGTAPHLIRDDELTVSLNGWTDEEGCWKTANGPEILYTGYSSISCFASGRMGGEDHLVWMDGNTLYDNGSSAGTITAGTSMEIKALDDGFLILGADVPYIYDGDHVRELGAWQYNTMTTTGVQFATPGSDSITGISKATSAVMTTTNPIYAAAGEYVYIAGVVGMTEVNGNFYKVASVAGSGPYSYTLEVDSSTFTTYSSGGTAYGGVAGIAGDYRWYLVPTLTRKDGTVMLGRARGLKINGYYGTYTETGSWDADQITLAGTNAVNIKAYIPWSSGGTNLFSITGTVGTDYTPGLRLYRTKDGGTDAYLEREWSHGDADFTAGATGYTIDTYYGGVPDGDLGAVYSPDFGDHDNPPADGDLAASVGQRLFLADGDKVYWSHLDGIEYWNDLDYVKMPDTVTALAEVRDRLVIFSADRMWMLDMYSGIPEIREIDTPVGTIYPKAMESVDAGLLFARTDGLWLFDGARVENIARRAMASLAAPQTVTAAADTVYVSGSAAAYVARIRDNGWVWHQADSTYDIADATSGKIYAASDTTVSQLFDGASRGGMLTTKVWGDLDETRQYRVVLDVSGQGRPEVSINGVRQDDIVPHIEAFPVTNTGRRTIRLPLPRLSNPFFEMTISTTGDLTVYGYRVEAER